ncbi:mitochondrial ribosomal protein subunit L27 [Protomyces lactucae-debilis]|uniref:Mitochondrial ribosomal protein subunit L27 n=1 Tax=Protomyces lactucae-debilis TaxID=2754530 RepID=A0A1Y2F7T0_PROLT|nr:mitochondrial ribosomal protein subunit L27 [Protomyces lactucae-debilis]ORY79931.1 mitochondrial ribosomal protein subunit L27 [Protomyces lactucae-debilis]
MVAASRVLQGARRLPLTTKQGHNYYKGTGTGSTGRHTKHGAYITEWEKVRTYPRPALLDSCTLKPFVSRQVAKARASLEPGTTHMTGSRYLEAWKLDNAGEQKS